MTGISVSSQFIPLVLSHCLSFWLSVRGPQLEMARPPHSKYLCVTTLFRTATAALRNRVMQTCPTILVKCCLVRNFLPPLANVVSQEQVQRGGDLHVLLGARERDSDRFQGGEGSFEGRGQAEGAEQLPEKEEPALLPLQVQELTEIRTLRNERMKNHLSWVFRRQASASGQDPTSTSGDKTNGGLVGQKESDEKKRRGRRKVRSREPSMRRDFEERRVTF